MSDQASESIIKTLEDEINRLVEAEEYDEALEALNVLQDFLGLERVN